MNLDKELLIELLKAVHHDCFFDYASSELDAVFSKIIAALAWDKEFSGLYDDWDHACYKMTEPSKASPTITWEETSDGVRVKVGEAIVEIKDAKNRV